MSFLNINVVVDCDDRGYENRRNLSYDRANVDGSVDRVTRVWKSKPYYFSSIHPSLKPPHTLRNKSFTRNLAPHEQIPALQFITNAETFHGDKTTPSLSHGNPSMCLVSKVRIQESRAKLAEETIAKTKQIAKVLQDQIDALNTKLTQLEAKLSRENQTNSLIANEIGTTRQEVKSLSNLLRVAIQ